MGVLKCISKFLIRYRAAIKLSTRSSYLFIHFQLVFVARLSIFFILSFVFFFIIFVVVVFFLRSYKYCLSTFVSVNL